MQNIVSTLQSLLAVPYCGLREYHACADLNNINDVVGFFGSGESWSSAALAEFHIQSNASILELGMGYGRLTLPFACAVPLANYHGIDVCEPMVEWCRQHLTTLFPSYHFHHANLANDLYRDHGGDAADYRFDFDDNTFDLVVAVSVFTHLVPSSMQNYLKEISRVLKTGGGALLTWFMLRDRQWGHSYEPHCRVLIPSIPEVKISYEQSYIVERCIDAGLVMKKIVLDSQDSTYLLKL